MDTQTTMMMIFPFLSPKEAALLQATCKKTHSHKGVAKTLSAADYARNWFNENHNLQAMECIGKLLVVNYPLTSLLKTKIIANNFQWLEEGDSANTYICELKITFSGKKDGAKKAVPEYEYTHHRFTGDFSSMPLPFIAE